MHMCMYVTCLHTHCYFIVDIVKNGKVALLSYDGSGGCRSSKGGSLSCPSAKAILVGARQKKASTYPEEKENHVVSFIFVLKPPSSNITLCCRGADLDTDVDVLRNCDILRTHARMRTKKLNCASPIRVSFRR